MDEYIENYFINNYFTLYYHGQRKGGGLSQKLASPH